MKPPAYNISSKIWLWEGGKGSWHFVSIPKETSQDIRKMFGYLSGGWGSIPVSATIGATTWATSIFPDTKTETYLIPVKAEVRKKEKLVEGNLVNLKLEVKV